jgi:hypothetical protein
MDLQAIGLLSLALGWAAFVNVPLAISGFVISTLLGSAAAIIITSVGISIQPAHLLLGFVFGALLFQRDFRHAAIGSVQPPNDAALLAATVIYGAVSAYFMPRLFAGETYINAIGATEHGFSAIPVPLAPTSGNITQTIYLAGDFVCFVLVQTYCRHEPQFKQVCKALMMYAAANVIFGVLDLATYYTGTSYLLDFIRNSTYQFHLDEEVDGLKRIAGSFTETSAFAYASIGALAYSTRLALGGVSPLINGLIAAATLTLLIMSTSTTAYVAIPLLASIIILGSQRRIFLHGTTPATAFFAIGAPLLLLVAGLGTLLDPVASAKFYGFVDSALLQKASSQSGVERAQWNTFAIQNFLDTYGLGAGVGSVRASSFPIACLANLGLIGTIFFFGFLYKVIRPAKLKLKPESFEYTAKAAARTSCIALVLTSSISGSLIDLGLPFFVLAGLATSDAEPLLRRRHTSGRAADLV